MYDSRRLQHHCTVLALPFERTDTVAGPSTVLSSCVERCAVGRIGPQASRKVLNGTVLKMVSGSLPSCFWATAWLP
jgi:hypothetical protein